jgi:hypothetical protein
MMLRPLVWHSLRFERVKELSYDRCNFGDTLFKHRFIDLRWFALARNFANKLQ